MKSRFISTLSFILLIFSYSCAAYGEADFLHCLSENKFQNHSLISSDVYTRANSSYTSILRFSIRNPRFASKSTPKPQVIITPEHESQIPPLIYCAKRSGLEIRTRSGGHDYEGLSYVSHVPFVIIDLINLNKITVDAEEKTAWVEAGANIGSLFYKIAERSPVLAFPAGFGTTVGVGGHFSGGGYGTLMRKYGLSADNVVDARIVDVNGRILDRKSMGRDLFWAIRGGGGASFGVIVAWKVQLVDIPERVTVFSVARTLEQNAVQLVHRWQYVAPELEHDLFVAVSLSRVSLSQEGRNETIKATFFSLFLGGVEELVSLMQKRFPELDVVREDCSEMSWVQSTLYFSQAPVVIPPPQQQPLTDLFNRSSSVRANFKVKSDYVQKPIPKSGLQGIVRLLYEPEASMAVVYLIPYGGIMAEISQYTTPFPHRGGNMYKLSSLVTWQTQNSDRYISWSRRYYSFLTPYVSRCPREAYLNYRDLDIGVNNVDGETSYAEASIWGKKYFKNNFDRLVRVKSVVDPDNFFKNEQSIPPLSYRYK